MSDVKHKVLVVDDDRFAQKLIVKALIAQYDLKTAFDGAEAVSIALDWMPSAILLDVEMPVKNGYEVCEELKNNPATSAIPIIFLSGNGSLREKLQGFELGAEDYLVKPFDADILNAKVKLATSGYHEKRELNERAQSAQGTAFEALTTSAELGRALRFVEHTFSIPSFDSLAQALFKCMSEFGLNTSVMFVSTSGQLFYSQTTLDVPPLEKDLLQIMHHQGRFKDFGCRTFCNYRQVSLLIKNMPLDDRERYGRIKDTVPFILGSVDGKIRALDVHRSLVAQASSLEQSIAAIASTLNSLGPLVANGHAEISEIMKSLLADLDERMPKLGLEEDQERYLVNRIDRSFTEVIAGLDRSLLISDSLTGVVRLLTHLQGQQQKMVDATIVAVDTANLPNDGETLSDDCEFF